MESVFHEAADLEGDARRALLDEACAGDDELRRDVERLLEHDEPEGTNGSLDPGQGLDLLSEVVSDHNRPRVPHPERVGRYLIRGVIAEGGMGVVYLAEQDHPRRRVALKLIRPGLFTEEILRRFQFEAELLGRLQHPGIAQIHDAGEAETDAGRQPYFALEYVEGLEVRKFADERALGPDERLLLLARICDAVHHAHQKGIVHRDLKPGNILVVDESSGTTTPDRPRLADDAELGQPKVLDFGVSRLIGEQPADASRFTRTGHVVGTVAYMSPEQARGETGVDTRSDVYSLGVIGFELLTGHTPHDSGEMPLVEALRTVQETPAPRLEAVDRAFRGDVSVIIDKALEHEPSRRYASAQALADDIRRHLADQPIVARPPTITYQLRRFVRRNKAIVAGAMIAVLALVLGLVFAVIAQKEEARLRTIAENSADEARRSAYASQIQAAHAYHAGGDTRAARQQLALAPDDLRGWEWYHLATSQEVDLRFLPMEIVTQPTTTSDPGDPRTPLALDGGVLRLLDLETGTSSDHALPGPDPRSVGAVALVSGTRTVLWGDMQGRVGTADLDGKIATRMLLKLDDRVHRIVLSRDGASAFISTLRDAGPTVTDFHVLDIASGRLKAEVAGRMFAYSHVLRPDGTLLASCLRDGRVVIRQVATLEVVREIQAHDGPVVQVAFSPDGRHLASAALDRTIRIWSVPDGRLVADLGPVRHPAHALAFHPDGKRLVTGHADAGVRCWDLESHACLSTTSGGSTPEPENSVVVDLRVTGEGDVVYAVAPDGVRLRHLTRPLPIVLEHEWGEHPYAYDAVFDPSGRVLFTAGWSGTVRVWDAATRQPIAVLACPVSASWSRLSRDGRHLVISSQEGYGTHILRSWDVRTLVAGRDLSYEALGTCGVFLRDGKAFMLAAETEIWIVDPVTLAVRRKMPVSSPVRSLAVSPNGTHLAYGTIGGSCVVLDARTLDSLLEFETGSEDVRALAFSPDGRHLATGGAGEEVRVWDVAAGGEILRFDTPGSRTLFHLVYTPDGRRILSASRRVSIGIREADSGREILRLHGHDGYVHALALSPDGRVLVSASGDNTVHIWDARPLTERIRERDRVLDAERKVRPLVMRLLDESETFELALAALAADAALTEIEKHAAWSLAHRTHTPPR
jgi:eukaryotic-like serine/threonine-protein kinase